MLRAQIQVFRKSTVRDWRKFGLVVGGVLVVAGLWVALARNGPVGHLFWNAGLVLAVVGLAAPRLLKWIYVGWMTVGLVLGTIVSTVLLTFLFYFVVTPIGLFARVMGNDFLQRRFGAGTSSYWIKRPCSERKSERRYEQQF